MATPRANRNVPTKPHKMAYLKCFCLLLSVIQLIVVIFMV